MKNNFLFVILLVVTSLAGQAQVNINDPLPIAPEIKKGTLSNGLTYFIRKNNRPEQKVELRLVIKAGSILEGEDQQGLAHFTEHMAFNGSTHFQKNELVSFLQSIGVKFGADLNAYTSFDETVYILPIPTDKPENLEKAFLVLEDWASAVAFDPSEIDKERGVVLEEERLGKGAQERMQKKTLPYILEGSLYAKRLPIGQTDILKTFKPDAITRYYRDWYRPDLMAVIVVGDIDPAQAEAMIKRHFEKLKNPAKERTRTYAAVPTRTTSTGLVVTDAEATNHIVQIFYPTQKAVIQTTIGDYRGGMVRSLVSSMLSQRMQELTQKAEPPFIAGGSGRGAFVHGYESYFAAALLGKAGIKAAIDALIQENERARQFGFSANELDRSRKSMLRSMERAYNERDKSESDNFADEYIRHFLNQEPIPGIENEFTYHQQLLSTITLEEINAYTAKLIPSAAEKKLVILQGPDKADFTLPTNDQLLAMVADAEKIPVTPYIEKAVATTLMAEAPAGGRILFDKKNTELGYAELSLGNGVKVIVKPTDFKNDEVVLSGFRFGGQSLFEDADWFSGQYAATLVNQMGIGEFSPTDLRKALAGKSVSVSPRLSNLSEGISGQSGTADVETMLQMVHLYFTKPRKDEALFKSFISKQQGVVKNMLSDPRTVFQDSTQRMLYQNHLRGPRMPRTTDFDKINLDRAMQIYGERFGNARGWTFYIVGSVDLAKLKPLIATYLGTLPSSTTAVSAYKDRGVRPIQGVLKKEIRKGHEPQSLIVMTYTGEATYSEEEQLHLQALIELMNIKLTETLREELSGIYGGGMNGTLNKNPYSNYTINVTLPCGPENVDKLIKATLAEIQKIKDHGPTIEDLNKVKEEFSKEHKEDLRDNSYWVSRLQRSAETGIAATGVLTFEERLKAITPQQIQDAAKRYLQQKNFFQAVLLPEK
ncbi:MAG TPA: insulinase family protein [Cyclobacteriaceae bacterium]|nr:insulinase family protein [Cyclobacteriaceae bacterium]